MTIQEAANKWVSGFSEIPCAIVEKLMRLDIDEVREITPGDRDEDEDAGYLPMWSTMWAFDRWEDIYWLERMGGLELMAKCGFRIYEQEDFGYIFGIDGAGYSFMEQHWLPLYKARGLCWHKESKAEAEPGELVQKIMDGRAE